MFGYLHLFFLMMKKYFIYYFKILALNMRSLVDFFLVLSTSREDFMRRKYLGQNLKFDCTMYIPATQFYQEVMSKKLKLRYGAN